MEVSERSESNLNRERSVDKNYMRQGNFVKKIRNLELKLQKKAKELEKSRLESEDLYVALDEAYTKLQELYPYIKLLQEENKENTTLH